MSEEISRCLGLPEVVLAAAPAGGAGHPAYEVFDPTRPGEPVAFLRHEGSLAGRRYGLHRESLVLPVAASLGLPVPKVLGTPGDPPGLLTEFVPGTSRPGGAQVEAVAPAYLALVAQLHAADPRAFPIEQFDTLGEAVIADIGWWEGYARDTGAWDEPIVRLAARVLRATFEQSDDRPSLVHGDVGAGNFMVEAGRVTAMLDWELAHVGDPHEDLAWLWMRGAHTSFGDPQRRLAEYESAAGRAAEPERMRWHLAFVMWKSCVGMYAELGRPPTSASLVQSMVILTYDALLGSQLLRLLGGSLHLLGQQPVRRATPGTQPADRLLDSLEPRSEVRLVLSLLRDGSAQARWERDALAEDLRSAGLPPSSQLLDCIDGAAPNRASLLPLANVIARAADRAATVLPNAVRRIERAQGIGLGTAIDPMSKPT